jgi:hypothetical protein
MDYKSKVYRNIFDNIIPWLQLYVKGWKPLSQIPNKLHILRMWQSFNHLQLFSSQVLRCLRACPWIDIKSSHEKWATQLNIFAFITGEKKTLEEVETNEREGCCVVVAAVADYSSKGVQQQQQQCVVVHRRLLSLSIVLHILFSRQRYGDNNSVLCWGLNMQQFAFVILMTMMWWKEAERFFFYIFCDEKWI